MALALTVFNQLSRKCQTYKTTLQPLSRTPHALYQYNYPFLRGSLLTYVVLAAVASIALDVSELPACQLNWLFKSCACSVLSSTWQTNRRGYARMTAQWSLIYSKAVRIIIILLLCLIIFFCMESLCIVSVSACRMGGAWTCTCTCIVRLPEVTQIN